MNLAVRAPRLGKALFLAGLLIGVASWLIEKTVSDGLAERANALDTLDRARLNVLSYRAVLDTLFLVRREACDRVIRHVESDLAHGSLPLADRERLLAIREFQIGLLRDARVAYLEHVAEAEHMQIQLLAPVAPDATRALHDLVATLRDEAERINDLDARAVALGREIGEEVGLAAFSALDALRHDADRFTDSYAEQVTVAASKLERDAAWASAAFKITYCLSALLVLVGEWLK